MSDLLRAALAGTAKERVRGANDDVERLLAEVDDSSPEARLLWAAGANAVYSLAGRIADASAKLPAPADAESLPNCSARAARMLLDFAQRQPEALFLHAAAKLAARRFVLPPSVLPAALAVSQPASRSALVPLLGARGRWLAQFDNQWAWANAAVADRDRGHDEKTWNEGTLAERKLVLAAVRSQDPAQAREWLQAVWAKEKPDVRQAMLESFQPTLSADDQPLLETAVKDRSKPVRETAAALLSLLPESPLAGRMRLRAEAMLSWSPAKPKLDIQPPAEFAKDWSADAITETPPAGEGARAFWLRQIVSFVPPTHWTLRFSSEPAAIVAATRDQDFRDPLLDGWTAAAVRFKDAQWSAALWDHWLEEPPDSRRDPIRWFDPLGQTLAVEARFERAEALFRDGWTDRQLSVVAGLFEHLPAPWPEAFAKRYFQHMKEVAVATEYDWRRLSTLTLAGVGCPDSLLGLASELVSAIEASVAPGTKLSSERDAFCQTVRDRQLFLHEISTSKED